MSIYAINKGTEKCPGGGLPVYEKLDHVFSNLSNGYNSDIGLWVTPNGKVPSFQIFVPYPNYISLVYHETRGGNDFTGTTFTVIGSPIKIFAGKKNGVQGYWMHTNQDGTMAIAPPNGRWVAFLTLNDGFNDFIYYTEEFITKPCCPNG